MLRGQNADPQCEVQAECCGPVWYSALYQTLVRHATPSVEAATRAPELGSGPATWIRMARAKPATQGDCARGADLLVPRALAGRSPAPYCRAERGLGEGRGNPRPQTSLAFPTCSWVHSGNVAA